ncbi:Glutathione import ATP-binding protein GsiA [Pelotomaculum sp. FP]|uniref:ABC transporter ATP-binding protein n=1 Tax=Pelotomaculum sp. FP TaxID=261474 RepID=UPI001064FC5F|nr:ABC transporter ATP-binding protein [Pelotomaculum sp. FP]TEB16755.1 Glutathione import ATP-binding protein GsiA [Pelotomaculum sp. FP]
MLEVKDLKVSYDGLPVINDVSFELRRGDVLAVVGESGAGKTTLGLSIIGLVAGSCTGRIIVNGRNILVCPEEERRRMRGKEVAMVFQNVEDALNPLYTVADQIVESLENHGVRDRAAAFSRTFELLGKVGLGQRHACAFPHLLSGGEKQRALIALALANDPDVLIFDEPTAALDALTKAHIISLLKRLSIDKISLVITHDIATAASLTNKMAILYGGRIVEAGVTGELLAYPRHPYTRGLLRSYPGMDTTKDLQGIPGRLSHGGAGCVFHPRCTQKAAVCGSEVPPLVNAGGRQIACHRGGIVPLLEIKKLSKSFGSHMALQGIELTLCEGETLALVGESGSGKTTLAKTVMGLIKADEGQILLDCGGEKAKNVRSHERVQMVFQNPGESINHRMNVLQAVKEPLDINRRGTEEEKLAQVKGVLNDVELPSDDLFLRKYPHQLSGGEVQRVAIARALVLNPKVLIADEPTSALDPSVQAKILKLLLNLQERKGVAILLITHDLALARKVSDRLAVIQQGRIVEEGPCAQVLRNPCSEYTRNLLAAMPGQAALEQLKKSPSGAGLEALPCV